jgi:ubiquitin-protein ligase
VTISRVSMERRRSDMEKLRALQASFPHLFRIVSTDGSEPSLIRLSIRIPTARRAKNPQIEQCETSVDVMLPALYPLPPGPTVQFRTPIFNPNVFGGGSWCYGSWSISETLGQFVFRLLRTIALDPEIVNPKSAANPLAAEWYRSQRRNSRHLFPTVSLTAAPAEPVAPKVMWRDVR